MNEIKEVGNVHLLVFRLDRQMFAVAFPHLVRLVKVQKVTPVPSVPDYLTGIVQVQGQFVPQVNLKMMLGLQDLRLFRQQTLAVVQAKGRRFCFPLDSKGDIVELVPSDLQGTADEDTSFYKGQFIYRDQIAFLIDVEALVARYGDPGE